MIVCNPDHALPKYDKGLSDCAKRPLRPAALPVKGIERDGAIAESERSWGREKKYADLPQD